MIDYETAFDIVLQRAKKLNPVQLPLEECAGMVLARDIRATERIPRFDSSSVDGFGISRADIASMHDGKTKTFLLQGAIRAGDPGAIRLRNGTACLVNTGARVPASVGAVIMKENCLRDGAMVHCSGPVEPGENIRRAGGEFRKGALLVSRGETITPPVVGLLATAGCAFVPVIRKPKVGIVVTGNEIRLPAQRLGPGEIRDSVSFSLGSALRTLGCNEVRTVRVKDDPAGIRKALQSGLKNSDLLLTAGGISVGEHDFVKQAFASLGVREIFWRVAIKPGKPAWFGVKGGTLCFGLPGNPVSAMVAFHLLVRPAILRMTGREEVRPVVTEAILGADLEKRTERLELVRARLARGRDGILTAHPVAGQESHMLGGLAVAHGLILFPRRRIKMRKGERVPVQLLDWGSQ